MLASEGQGRFLAKIIGRKQIQKLFMPWALKDSLQRPKLLGGRTEIIFPIVAMSLMIGLK
jgi:hypothetical protein